MTVKEMMAREEARGAKGKADEASEEDKALSDTLDMLIERLQEADRSLHRAALEALRMQIRSSAVSLTSIPKALKFLCKKFSTLMAIYLGDVGTGADDRRFLADILSVVAMAAGEDNSCRYSLLFRLLGEQRALGEDWGHEYVRHLAAEAIQEHALTAAASLDASAEMGDEASIAARRKAVGCGIPADAFRALVRDVAVFFLDHNAEPDACDLLYEVGDLASLPGLLFGHGGVAGKRDHERVCLYLLSCVPFEGDDDDRAALSIAHAIYREAGDHANALIVAMRLNDHALIVADFDACPHGTPLKLQLAFMLARQRISLPPASLLAQQPGSAPAVDERLQGILNNACLTDHFRQLTRDLEIVDVKSPDDIYKSHLQDAFRISIAPSPRQNVAAALVNGFVNGAFTRDALVCTDAVDGDETLSWIYKVKEHGITTTVASIGLIHLWSADSGLEKLDRYLYSENVFIKAGAILGIGLVHAGTRSESDPALALLREYIDEEVPAPSAQMADGSAAALPAAAKVEQRARRPVPQEKIAALMGLALAYGGSARHDVVEAVLPLISDANMQVASMAALTVGHVFVGTCDGDMASAILQTLMERQPADLDAPFARFMALSLGLLFLGKTETEAEVILETLAVIDHPIGRDAATLVKVCSYAGSGNVLKIQELLHICTRAAPQGSGSSGEGEADAAKGSQAAAAEGDGEEDKAMNCQSFAVIGIALICMMEDIGKEMSSRLFSHLMQFGSAAVRKCVPLALGLMYTSNATVAVSDLLSKYSHDQDKSVAISSIFALGLVAAGTNNARMAQTLRQLAAYYQRDVDCLYIVRFAQGLVHASKGSVTFSPIHCHRQLISAAAVAGLLTTIIAMTDAQALLVENTSYLVYFLTTAIYPRFVVALSAESLESVPALMRVGQAVDVVGQAGKPKTISGFATHTAPVLLAYQDRAEMASEEFIPLTPVLENFVLLQKNPHWIDDSLPGAPPPAGSSG